MARRIVQMSRPAGRRLLQIISDYPTISEFAFRHIPLIYSGNTIWAASPSLAHVQAAIASAYPGDTVRVPAGNADWPHGILIDKPIRVLGAGIGFTNIRMTAYGGLPIKWPGRYALQYKPANDSLDYLFRFSGFTFDLNYVATWLFLGDTSKKAPFVIPYQVRFDHNRVINPHAASGAQFIYNSCTMYGVVDSNSFEGGWYFVKSDPSTYNDLTAWSWWTNAPNNICNLGANNYLYFEDNVWIHVDGTSDSALSDGQFSGRYAFRYNEFRNFYSTALFDLHGHGPQMDSCFGAELYGNRTIPNGNALCTLLGQRGGRSLCFNNSEQGKAPYMKAYGGEAGTKADQVECLQMINHSYWWGNRADYSGSLGSSLVTPDVNTICGTDNHPQAGRDIMTPTSSPAFISAGTLANRPTNPVVNQGYWATNQSVTDLTGMVGCNPATPISGILYVCLSAGVWTEYFTPYAYPHPLRNL